MRKFKDFTLKTSDGTDVTLSEVLKDNKAWLLFYRGAFWGVWAKELVQLHQVYDRIVETGTKVLAISVDGQANANVMKEKTGVNFDILCDENLDVIQKYNLEDEELIRWDFINGKSRKIKEPRSISLSANILINKQGTIISEWNGHYSFRPSSEETLEILRRI